MKKGLLIILSGPSGVGKGTVREYIVKTNKIDITFSVSMTTRKPREGETDGVEYYFVSQEEFDRHVANGDFLEHASFVGNSYGTPKQAVEDLRNQGKNVFLEIEVNGATQVLNTVNDEGVISFFLMPPSIETLKKRIAGRRTESKEIIEKRVAKGMSEIKEADKYDYVIINDKVKTAGEKIIKIIQEKLA
ncbi:MAG: guanylate kinase [Erysipelotrichaceae bacterium]|nr:guanylate kinase [Erysipelotrichaceae bacterium]